jgi:uncharacterized protein (UPF0276 family)
MQLAINYSYPTADLLRSGRVQLDRFKCPAWPDLIAQAQADHPVCIHFPLTVGAGIGDAMDVEKQQRADWDAIEAIMRQTDTPFINVHLTPRMQYFPAVPGDSTDPADIAYITERLIADVAALVARFGAEHIIAENCHRDVGSLLIGSWPHIIRHVIYETGCGLLFDLSHARLAAAELGMDPYAYIAALPMDRMREMHVTGVQQVDEHWLNVARLLPDGESLLQRFHGHLLDHLPMTDTDWLWFAWALAQIRAGVWSEPWSVGFEVGGVGPLWEAIADAATLAVQVPRLYAMVHAE